LVVADPMRFLDVFDFVADDGLPDAPGVRRRDHAEPVFDCSAAVPPLFRDFIPSPFLVSAM
jgi:hypothetical protein